MGARGGPWKEAYLDTIGWVLGGGVALVAALAAHKRWSFARRGYDAMRHFRDQVRYVERAPDNTRREIVLDGEMLVGQPHVVYAPNDERWNADMPGWARGRRREILERIRECFTCSIEESRRK